jgi:VanZ family protein
MSGWNRIFLKYWFPAIVWAGIILAGSTDILSSQKTSRILVPLIKWFAPNISQENLIRTQFFIRKLGHITEYAILSILFWRARRKPQKWLPQPWLWREALVAIVLALMIASADEIHQSFEKTREGSVRDVMIDGVGASIGIVGLYLWGKWQYKW